MRLLEKAGDWSVGIFKLTRKNNTLDRGAKHRPQVLSRARPIDVGTCPPLDIDTDRSGLTYIRSNCCISLFFIEGLPTKTLESFFV